MKKLRTANTSLPVNLVLGLALRLATFPILSEQARQKAGPLSA